MVAATLVLLSAACATQPELPRFFKDDPPGFFTAVLHGGLAPLALIVSLFSDTRIYAYPNSGFSYDLGYLLGMLPWVLGLAHLLRRWRSTEPDDYGER